MLLAASAIQNENSELVIEKRSQELIKPYPKMTIYEDERRATIVKVMVR